MGFEIFDNQNKKTKFAPPNPNGFGFGVFAPPEPPPAPVSRDGWNMLKGEGYSAPTSNFRMLDDLSLQQDIPKSRSALGRFADALGNNPVTRTIDAFGEKGANALSFGLFDKLKSHNEQSFADKGITLPDFQTGSTAEKIAGGLGTFTGSVLPVAGAYKATGSLAKGLLPNVPKLVDRLGRGALAGTAYGLANEGIDSAFDTRNDGSQSLGQRAGNVGMDAALFGAGDAALHGVGMGLKKVADSTGMTKWAKGLIDRMRGPQQEFIPSTLPDKLGLPQPYNPIAGFLPQRPIAGLLPAPPKPDFIAGFGQQVTPRRFTPKQPESGLNFQRPEAPSTYRAVNPAERQLQELFNVGEQRGLSVGREYEDLQNLLGQISDRSGISLDDLINESTKQIRMVERVIGKRVPMNPQSFLEVAQEVAERNRLAQAAGVMVRPPVGQRPTVDVPFITPVQRLAPKPRVENASPIQPPPIGDLGGGFRVGDRAIPMSVDGTHLSNPVKIVDVQMQDGKRYYRFEASSTYFPEEQVVRGMSKPQGNVKPLGDPLGIKKNESAVNVGPMAEVAAGREPALNISPARKQEKDPDIIQVNEIPVRDYNLSQWKDISGFKGYMTDAYRVLKDASGKDFDKVKANLLDPFDAAKKANIETQEKLIKDLKTNVVDKLGIKKGSKDSALVQMYGEKEITLDELKKRAPGNWQRIVEADGWFRKTYDNLLDEVNATRKRIYPNDPEKIVPKRDDYYRHFNELTQLSGLKNLFDTPSAIDPSLVGVSEFTKPNSKFAGFMQRRGLGPYKRDAVGGFLEYTPAASYSIHIDPQIGNFKELSKGIAKGTEESKHLNNLINFLHKYTQDLAGKTNPADRFIQEIVPGGRTTMAALHWLNNRVKANTILGNVGSTLAQIANIPNGIAFAKQHSVKGAGRALASIVRPDEAMAQSGFLKERFAGKMYRQFDTKIIEQPRRLAEWMMETSDRLGTSFVWNSAYAKGRAQKVADPVKYADDATRNLIAGRGIGEVPLLQKSKLFQLVAPFQLEVANLWRVQRDFVKEKDFGALATLYLGAFVFNKAMEEVRGSGVMFDPIQAIREAMADDLTPLERGGRLAGEVLSNIPLGQNLTSSVYPEYGFEAGGLKFPTRKKLFGDNDPTRFGEGLTLTKGFQDPAYKLLLPFGGNQLKKTFEGISAISKDGSYQNTFANDPFNLKGSNALKFPIDMTPATQAQSLAFGPNATSEAKQYYKDERRPLSEKQTQQYESLPDSKKPLLYNGLMKERTIDSAKRKIDAITKDTKLTKEEKQAQIVQIINKLREQSK